jgi:hypothetical protein
MGCEGSPGAAGAHGTQKGLQRQVGQDVGKDARWQLIQGGARFCGGGGVVRLHSWDSGSLLL